VILLAVLALLVTDPASGAGAIAAAPADTTAHGAAPAGGTLGRARGIPAGADTTAADTSAAAAEVVRYTGPAAPVDSTRRIPGTPFRLGASVVAAAAHGLQPATGSDWQGAGRFFGIECAATLSFPAGRLARGRFIVSDASPAEIAYVQDQLTAMGYHRRCPGGAGLCDWTGGTLVHLQVGGGRIDATVTAVPVAPAPVAAGAPSAHRAALPVNAPAGGAGARSASTAAASPADSGPGTLGAVPVQRETLAVPLPGRPSRFREARALETADPRYPEAARRAGIQGRVWTIALVDTSGRVLEATVERGIPELNGAALEAVGRWRFEPRTWQGRSCRYHVEVPVTFRLF
jgi:TonB family protein